MISDEHGGTRAGGAPGATVPPPEADPLVVTAQRVGTFLRTGWDFTTVLAERLPRLYLTGWQL